MPDLMNQQPSTPGIGSAFGATLMRELLIAFRHRSEVANPLLFFLMLVTLLPLGIAPDAQSLSGLAAGMIWVFALLATLLSLDLLYKGDYDDGSLAQLLMAPQPLMFHVLAKVIVHWCVTGLPLTLISPLMGVLLNLPTAGYFPLIVSLLLGTMTLSLIGSIGAALTVTLKRGGLLISLVILPLYIPVLIFGSSAVSSAIEGYAINSQLAVLGALLAMSVLLAPLASAGALKISSN